MIVKMFYFSHKSYLVRASKYLVDLSRSYFTQSCWGSVDSIIIILDY